MTGYNPVSEIIPRRFPAAFCENFFTFDGRMIISFLSMELSIYIHFPFCVKRCHYCDFNTFAGKQNLIPDYISALVEEIDFLAKHVKVDYPIHTIYFGGGTPSLMTGSDLQRILGEIKKVFDLSVNPEITLEANPGTVEQSKLEQFRQVGINRLSFGVQSFQTEELKLLGRIHTIKDAEIALVDARRAGFKNINLDLIYGLPFQTLKKWKESLQKAVELKPTHLSLYSLLIEPGTLLETRVHCGSLPFPDEDLAAEMYEWAMDVLPVEGFQQYEISNWCKSDENGKHWLSFHNLQYWKNLPYLGIGAGAHGSILSTRTENVRGIEDYIRKITGGSRDLKMLSPANEKLMKISRWEEIQETMMLGLRLTQQGVIEEDFLSRFGKKMELFFPKQIEKLLDQKLIEWGVIEGKIVLRLTKMGRLLGNRVFSEFVGNPAPEGFS
jgi:oxygen-independent coproporphyrinogen-3 oxidase